MGLFDAIASSVGNLTDNLFGMVNQNHQNKVNLRMMREQNDFNAKQAQLQRDLVAVDGTTPATAAAIAGIVVKDVSAPATTNTAVVILARGAAGVSTAGLKLGTLALADVKAKLLTLDIKVLTAI